MPYVMNRGFIFASLAILPAVFTIGCETSQTGLNRAPARATASNSPDDLESLIERARRSNEEARARQMREQNAESVRAFNRETGTYEFVPLDSLQHWNEEEQRWEFTPRESPIK